MARRVADNPKLIYAAPSYVERHGAPHTIEDLADHQCLTWTNSTHWQFVIDGMERSVPVSGRFSSSSVDGFLSACVCGRGLAQLSAWDAQDEVTSGRLVPMPILGAAPRDLAI
ncbi:LysR substrate-binding domain-containing protein [Roseitranquillus sediminis]|uniref:LysR substrate-binding domain-containing protein n=1 Tax=Roseitranquillus sediminis TaxID=2809051 RepID=UPI003872A8AA